MTLFDIRTTKRPWDNMLKSFCSSLNLNHYYECFCLLGVVLQNITNPVSLQIFLSSMFIDSFWYFIVSLKDGFYKISIRFSILLWNFCKSYLLVLLVLRASFKTLSYSRTLIVLCLLVPLPEQICFGKVSVKLKVKIIFTVSFVDTNCIIAIDFT